MFDFNHPRALRATRALYYDKTQYCNYYFTNSSSKLNGIPNRSKRALCGRNPRPGTFLLSTRFPLHRADPKVQIHLKTFYENPFASFLPIPPSDTTFWLVRGWGYSRARTVRSRTIVRSVPRARQLFQKRLAPCKAERIRFEGGRCGWQYLIFPLMFHRHRVRDAGSGRCWQSIKVGTSWESLSESFSIRLAARPGRGSRCWGCCIPHAFRTWRNAAQPSSDRLKDVCAP